MNKNHYPRTKVKRRRYFLEIEFHERPAYSPGRVDLADVVLGRADLTGRYYTAVMVSADDESVKIQNTRRLTAQEASRLDRLDSTPDELLDVSRNPKYKSGNISDRFDNIDQIISWLDTQIMCDNLPVDEVYHCTENDTKLVWSRKP